MKGNRDQGRIKELTTIFTKSKLEDNINIILLGFI